MGLATHFRVIEKRARAGLPEVTLGVVPGAGGTQRLPRLIGVLRAIEMVSMGKLVDARTTLLIGLADRIVDGNLLDAAVAEAKGLVGQPLRMTSRLPIAEFDQNEVGALQRRL